MRKILFALLAVSLLMVSCSKDDDKVFNIVGTEWTGSQSWVSGIDYKMDFKLAFADKNQGQMQIVFSSIYSQGPQTSLYPIIYTYDNTAKTGTIAYKDEDSNEHKIPFKIDGDKFYLQTPDEFIKTVTLTRTK